MKKSYLTMISYSVLTVVGCTSNVEHNKFISYDTDVIPMVIDSSAYFDVSGEEYYDYHLVNTSTGEEIFSEDFRECTAFLDGIAVASNGKSEYYIGKDGKKIIDEDFIAATLFTEGRAWVIDTAGIFRVIDRKGRKLFSEKGALKATVFHEGKSVVVTETGIKVIDKAGNTLVHKDCQGSNFVVGDLLTVIDAENNVGVIDMNGRFVINPIYSSIGPDEYSDVNAYIDNIKSGKLIVADNNSIYGVVSKSGETIIPFEYVDISQDGDSFLVTKESVEHQSVQKTWLDQDGNVLIDNEFNMAFEFGDADYAAVYDTVNDAWGFIDRLGNWKLEPRFLGYVRSFDENGLALVDESGSNSGLIGEDGEFVIKSDFQFLSQIKGTDKYLFVLDNKTGIMDKTGAVLVEPKYDWCGGIYSGAAPLDYDAGFGPHLYIQLNN